jgi:S-adenosylmethionine decarboxylase
MAHRGVEWLIEAQGCDAWRLRDLDAIDALFAAVIRDMALHPVGTRTWHQFPMTGGITAVSLLSESHLACHTFPEYGSICLNLFCCRERAEADFTTLLREHLGAKTLTVRRVERHYEAEFAADA